LPHDPDLRIHGLRGDRLERIFEVKARGRVQ
jgi:hypothetical protein